MPYLYTYRPDGNEPTNELTVYNPTAEGLLNLIMDENSETAGWPKRRSLFTALRFYATVELPTMISPSTIHFFTVHVAGETKVACYRILSLTKLDDKAADLLLDLYYPDRADPTTI